jgi:hypothetical protein
MTEPEKIREKRHKGISRRRLLIDVGGAAAASVVAGKILGTLAARFLEGRAQSQVNANLSATATAAVRQGAEIAGDAVGVWPPEVLARLRLSIGIIGVRYTDTDQANPLVTIGTAWAVGLPADSPRDAGITLVTAAHVLTDDGTHGLQDIQDIYFHAPGIDMETVVLSASDLGLAIGEGYQSGDARHDLGAVSINPRVVTTAMRQMTRLLVSPSDTVSDGGQLVAAGYPVEFKDPDNPMDSRSLYATLGRVTGIGNGTVEIHAESDYGSSGGPVVDRHGNAVAMWIAMHPLDAYGGIAVQLAGLPEVVARAHLNT